jgi:hypothetical protein
MISHLVLLIDEYIAITHQEVMNGIPAPEGISKNIIYEVCGNAHLMEER